MKKRILTTIVVAIVALAIVACGIGSDRELSNDYIIIHQYKGLEIPEMNLNEVTDDDVESWIQQELMEQIEHRVVTERATRNGDHVTIDFAGTVNGVLIREISSEGFQFHLGSGFFDYYEGFEEQMEGRVTGENFEFSVQLPNDFGDRAHGMDHLNGELAVFNVTVHSITEMVFPQLTNEWVQANSRGGSTTVEEYRAEVREHLEESNHISNVSMLQERVFEALMEHVEVLQIPQEMIDREVAMQEEVYRNIAAAEGLEFEEYLRFAWQMDLMMFREVMAELSEESIIRQLVTELIMEEENLQLSEEEMIQRVEQIAFMSGMDSAREYLELFGEEAVHIMINQLRVAEFLIEHGQFVESEEEEFDWEDLDDWPEDLGPPEDWEDWDDWEEWYNPEESHDLDEWDDIEEGEEWED